MRSTFNQETISEYAAEGTKVNPDTEYSKGVKYQWTCVAGWWNWLFNKITRMLAQHRTDEQSVFTEVKNAILGSGMTMDATDNEQLHKAVIKTTKDKCAELDTEFPSYDEATHTLVIPYDVFQGVRYGND